MRFEDYIWEIAKQASEKLGGILEISTLRAVQRSDGASEVSDAKLVFFIDGKKRQDDAVIIISNPRFPDAVRNATKTANSVALRLDPSTRSHILLPLAEGFFGHQSYAVFHKLEEFSGNRWIRYVQKKFLMPNIAAWLEALAQETRQHCKEAEIQESMFLNPMNYLSSDNEIPSDIRKFARYCSSRISNNDNRLLTTIEHGDFWFGNVLFERRRLTNLGAFFGNFFVIDWGGARLNGYPCVDIVRYCLSTTSNHHQSARIVRAYAAKMGMSSIEVGLHCMAALGHIGLHRNQFPKNRYLVLVKSVFYFLNQHCFTKENNRSQLRQSFN